MSASGTTRRTLMGCAFFSALMTLGGGGCLDRPVAPASPNVTARIAEKVVRNRVDKIDLLFMIDNSSSMADKQDVLAEAIPDLVNRLLHPICIEAKTGAPAGQPDAEGRCTPPSERDFEPVNDIHVGIISSSLGDYGTGVCNDAHDLTGGRLDPHNNDMGHLVARAANAADLPSAGFLSWDGTGDSAALKGTFAEMVHGVGQHGCGYEASLEAIYRFLIDPEPYQGLTRDSNGLSVPTGTDDVVLKQRAAFLRPDSLVAIIMVTDENDCSIQAEGQGFLAIAPATSTTAPTPLARGTSACERDPNDRCCFNCGALNPPADCPSTASDPSCLKGHYTGAEDPPGLRCFHQKQRHGVDFLYPVDRYIQGLKQPTVTTRDGQAVKNPLFDDLGCGGKNCAAARDPSMVFLAGIVGVPWQDIAKDPHDLSQGYKTAKNLRDDDVWPVILGDPSKNAPPTDPLMIESIAPRTSAASPIGTKEAPQPPDGSFGANSINGHEWEPAHDSPPNQDLQYACVFELQTPKDCANSPKDCDCYGQGNVLAAAKNPLCQDPQTGAYGTMQFRAKGYPGLRQLEVLRGLGDQGIVASICPAETRPTKMADQDWGYRPAIAALLERLRVVLNGKCLPRTLEVDQDKNVPCIVVEAFDPPNGVCDCRDPSGPPGREPVDPQVMTDEIASHGCACQLVQLTGEDRDSCQEEDPYSGKGAGWCYVDPEQGGSCALVKNCSATQKRIVRFVGPNHDSDPRGTTFITCQEKSFSTSGDVAPTNRKCGG
jgi:hypothetical protein